MVGLEATVVDRVGTALEDLVEMCPGRRRGGRAERDESLERARCGRRRWWWW